MILQSDVLPNTDVQGTFAVATDAYLLSLIDHLLTTITGADYIPVRMASCTLEHTPARGASLQANISKNRLVDPCYHCPRSGRLECLVAVS